MKSFLLLAITSTLVACGGGGTAAGTAPAPMQVCISRDAQPFWFHCPDDGQFKASVPPEGYFVRNMFDEWNSDLEFNGIAYAVDGQYFLKGSNEPIGKGDQASLVMEVSKGYFVVYR